MFHKKLIEVALPLETINAEAAREKSIRHGHPSTLHLWWARRPLAAARAVIWASLVDDPSSHPELFPTEEEQNKERERLFGILERIVKWENLGDVTTMKEARDEILKWTNGAPPALLDPFAGGGAIPLEAQRLGLEAHAHDLNPVAVMINKAMIEIPPRFAGKPPVHPKDGKCQVTQGAAGLAEDVRYYGEWMKEEAFRRIGHLYPKIRSGKEDLTVIAWIWARTVKCPNPACGCEMPLASSFVLSKKKGNEAWIEPVCEGSSIGFKIRNEKCPEGHESNKVGRSGLFQCPKCGTVTSDPYIKEIGKKHEMGTALMAVVAEGKHGRIYLAPDPAHYKAACMEKGKNSPSGSMPSNPRWFSPPAFGMTEFSDLFTNRQLTALCTFSDLVEEARKKATADAVAAGLPNDGIGLDDGGHGATAYGQAVGVYLALLLDKLTDYNSSICSWHNSREIIRNTFGRQAIPMVWDFAEGNPFSSSTGSFSSMIDWVAKVLDIIPASVPGHARQMDAQVDSGFRNLMISTDPPYYDNIGYADLSDFFYVWLRQSLKSSFPQLFRTLQVPKKEELVATPYRFEGNAQKAKTFFEDGMFHTCQRIYDYSQEDIPVTIYYAYKQSDSAGDETSRQTASTGWETMLTAIIKAGFTITGTWPMRTEMANRSVASGTNALASSIVLVCRKRPTDAPACTRRNFVNELHRELLPALKKLQSGSIAPVDLAQSAIGPGMAVFSKYSQVFESNGSQMTVRDALAIINQELDIYFSNQDSGLDPTSNFCVTLYTQVGFGEIKFGEADTLARAKNISVETLADQKILFAEKGTVHLQERRDLPKNLSHNQPVWLQAQILTHAMETGGNQACADLMKNAGDVNPESARELAYRLYTIADGKGWTNEAYAYNSLIIAWPEIQALRMKPETTDGQMTMNEGFDN